MSDCTRAFGHRMKLAALIGMVFTIFASGSALAQNLPNPTLQEVLVKSSLLTFNDANVTGNYTVLHAKLAKPFRDQITPEKLKAAFKGFADGKIDFDIIAAKPIVPISEDRQRDLAATWLFRYRAESRELRSRLSRLRRRMEAQ